MLNIPKMKKIKFILTNEQFDKLLTPKSAQNKTKQILQNLMIPDVYHKLKNVCVYTPTQLRTLISWGLKDNHCKEIGLDKHHKQILEQWYQFDQSYKYNEKSGGNKSMYKNIV